MTVESEIPRNGKPIDVFPDPNTQNILLTIVTNERSKLIFYVSQVAFAVVGENGVTVMPHVEVGRGRGQGHAQDHVVVHRSPRQAAVIHKDVRLHSYFVLLLPCSSVQL